MSIYIISGVIALMLGMATDFFIGRFLATWCFPSIVGGVWLLSVTFDYAKNDFTETLAKSAARQAEKSAQMASLYEHCDKIGERDPQSLFQKRQIGYRCPSADGKPPVEHWVNQ